MKKTLLVLFPAILALSIVISCGTSRVTQSADMQIRAEEAQDKDSTEYELIIMDPHFDIWLLSQPESINTYSDGYLKSKNITSVMGWNSRYNKGDRRISTYLDYNTSIDYGLEFNYRLFMYFKYFEETHKIKLVR